VLISEDLGGSPDRIRVDAGFRAVFDRLSEQGCSAVPAGSYQQDAPPADGGRWGLSAVATLDDQTQQQLTGWCQEIQLLAGDGHWPTGAHGSAHVTVRAIQPHRPGLDNRDPYAARCGQAIIRAASCLDGPLVFRLQGLTLSPAGVLACLYPVDATAGTLAAAVRRELGADGWFEESYARTIWYASLVHFTTGIADPAGLVRWVTARRDLKAGDALATRLQLVTYQCQDRMVPVVLDETRLPDSRLAVG
jgi:hypothetical protein